jgi:iron complex outermembrane receptor protein
MGDSATLTPRISVHYETDSWLSVFNYGNMDKQQAYTRTDIGLRYNSGESWYVDAFVRNLENANIKTSAAGGSPLGGQASVDLAVAQYMPPRTFGVNMGYNF